MSLVRKSNLRRKVSAFIYCQFVRMPAAYAALRLFVYLGINLPDGFQVANVNLTLTVTASPRVGAPIRYLLEVCILRRLPELITRARVIYPQFEYRKAPDARITRRRRRQQHE